MTADPASSTVTLQPVSLADLEAFAEWLTTAEGTGEFQWFGFTSATGLRERFARDGLLGPDGGVLAVADQGTTVGRVEWFSSTWGPPTTSSCWSIAVGIHAGHRGRGIGTAAQRLLVEYLFATTRAERIQAWTDAANIVEQRALVGAGFELEGRLRRAQGRAGAWHDQLLYSVLRAA